MGRPAKVAVEAPPPPRDSLRKYGSDAVGLRERLLARKARALQTTRLLFLALYALVFGGDVTHGGMLITAGRRSVLVASFSTRTPDSPPDRTYGLQPAPAEAAGSLRRNW